MIGERDLSCGAAGGKSRIVDRVPAFWRGVAPFDFAGASSLQVEEQAAAFLGKLPQSLAVNSLLAASVVGILFGHQPAVRLILWLFTVVAVNAARYAVVFRFSPDARAAVSRVLLRRSLVGAFGSGLAWSLACAFLVDFHQAQGPLVLVVACGLTAGAALHGSSFAGAVLAMTVPILLTITVRLSQMPNHSGFLLGLDVLLYALMLVVSSLQSQKMMTTSIVLRERATSLAAQLKVESQASREAAGRFFDLANRDSLTGLANRACFGREFDDYLAQAQREGDALFVFLIDVDRFKAINDTLGHAAGDEVLSELARRLRAAVAPNGLVARLGGDEFALLWPPDAADARDLEQSAQTLLGCVAESVTFRERAIPVSLSVGAARFPADGATSHDLLTRADLGLYAAKAAGRNGWRAFDTAMLETAQVARDVERDLRAALEDGGVEVWFQPQIELASGALTGLECLIRWNHPRHGWIPPPTIVEAAFKTQAAGALTALVLRHACEMLWRCGDADLGNVIVAVNVSPGGLKQYDLEALVATCLEVSGIDPRRLELEITEDSLLDTASIGVLSRIAETGVRLAIDDFGTGCASLSYLRELKVDRIKIDRCFVTGVAGRSGDQALVQAILGIGRALGIEVIAEGVETPEDARSLATLGCRLGQGYHFGKAMPLDALLDRFATASSAGAWAPRTRSA